MTPAVELEKVTARMAGRDVLHDVSLALAPTEVLAVLGPSGSGKTTLLRTILGFVTPAAGAVRVAGQTASGPGGTIVVPPERRNLAVVYQDLALWPHLTVVSHLTFGLHARGHPRGESQAKARAMLRRLGIEHVAERRPGMLSGGERQRVAIARALVLEPVAVLLDEPLASLDVVLRREIVHLFRTLLGGSGVPALYVTHDPREVTALADRVVVLDGGRVVQTGTLADLRARPVNDFVRELVTET